MAGPTNGHDLQATEAAPEAAQPLTDDLSGPATPATPEVLEATPGDWTVSETLRGRHILITGSTGFLAKVLVVMLLRYHPDIAQLYLVIRGRASSPSRQRFYDEIVSCGIMEPLEEIYGEGLGAFLDERVTVLDGDISRRFLGLGREQATEISGKLDLFMNSAGLTNFNPNLENALRINTLSMRHLIEFIGLGGNRASLLHVSTAFVAGNTTKPSPEVLPHPHLYPAYEDIEVAFEAEREIEDCLRMISHAAELADDQERRSLFTIQAREALRKKNLPAHDEGHHFQEEYDATRREWVKRHLSGLGRERAAHWGWPNIYTYSKSLGERLLAAQKGTINFSICRPAIIESSESFPSPGWNEGINTSAPLCYLRYKGHRFFPTRDGVNLDIIPVDYVCGAMIGIGAALLQKAQEDVYHLGSSDLNPLSMHRVVELTSLGVRRLRDREVNTPKWKKLVLNTFEGTTVTEANYNRRSAPGARRALGVARGLLGKLPTQHMGGVGKAIKQIDRTIGSAERGVMTLEKMFEIFMPFIHHNKFTFRARNIGALAAHMSDFDRKLYGSPIEDLCWRTYWIDIHMPGLAKHTFPALDEKLTASTKESYTYDDLVELFDASTTNHASRIALQHHHGTITEQYTYAELGERAGRAQRVLEGMGVKAGVAVVLVSENRPQWGMVYFGILKAHGVAVPADPNASAAQIVNIITSSRARVVVLSDAVRARIGADVEQGLREAGHFCHVVVHDQLLTLQLGHDPSVTAADAPPAHQHPTELANLIYTSGTTGAPKGVMLTHRNFTHLLSSMNQVFRIGARDGFLSVLPLHHTFEFSCGFLMPLSKGATVTYLEELNGDELSHALRSTRITAVIGVPALWQLLHRRVEQRMEEQSPAIQWVLDQLMRINRFTRRKMGINIGPVLFNAVHQGFGGNIRYFISGAASLSGDVLKAFQGLGFDMYEGYGLTEAAPVLTVNRPGKDQKVGSVGRPLPGVEVAIHNPNAEGIGEVVARGKNVMRGYLDREEETEKALRDGWLYTGDLGRIDGKGRLDLVGREKEVIVTSGGKNVYPDELEAQYGKNPHIEELSIVGLPDGHGAERVACLVRVILDEDADAEAVANTRHIVREWFRVEGQRVASHNRVQVLRFWEEELPRTASRKVKRPEVVKILERLIAAEQEAHEQEAAANASEDHGEWLWLDRIIATLADMDVDRIFPSMHFQDDLGFDSLMSVELLSILEARGHHIPPARRDLLETIQQLRDEISGSATALVPVVSGTIARTDDYHIPRWAAQLGKRALHRAQIGSYANLFNVSVLGKANIPQHDRNVIVIANHSSHLDMGLVKYALGDYGAEIRAVAAADYFFKNPARKTYFTNFTNLLPLERGASMEQSLQPVADSLQRGEMILLFPEGTRSRDGKLQPFRRGVGYLVAQQRVSILPVYLEGTHRALPKGQPLPSPTSRNLKVIIGKPLDAFALMRECEGLSPNEQYQYITDQAQKAIEALRDRDKIAAAMRGKPTLELAPIFESLHGRFERDQLDAPVSYYFSLGADDDQKWTVSVDGQTCSIANGKPAGGAADCVVKTTPEIFRRMIQESYIPPFEDFMNGTIKTNAPDLLMRFPVVFQL